jgi:hypothetical protein
MSSNEIVIPLALTVTRQNAKQICTERLQRLHELNSKSDNELSQLQKNEKHRIIRLEKNRQAAALSRKRKKIYIQHLEYNCNAMEKQIIMLQMENGQLRTLLNDNSFSFPPLPPIQHEQPFPLPLSHFEEFLLPPPPPLPLPLSHFEECLLPPPPPLPLLYFEECLSPSHSDMDMPLLLPPLFN